MKTLICYSGGFDSTALLLNELQNGYHVDTCYFELPNNTGAQSIELKNRKKILKYVSKITKDPEMSGTLGNDVVYNLYTKFDNRVYLHLQQAYLWIQFLILKVDLSKYDRVVFGYVKYDDFWHFKNEFIELYNSSVKLTVHKNTSKLVYPFEWCTKKDVLKWYDTENFYNKNVSKYIKKIEKLTFYCETPVDGKACKKCDSCKRHKSEIGNEQKRININ